jgi:AcrR family transcriptional regulator
MQVVKRRKRYLEAAQALFATNGFVATTMDMIIAETGGSKATLYKYFPSKDDLIAGLMDDIIERIRERAHDPALDGLPLAEALTEFGTITLATVVSADAVRLLRLSLGEYARFPQLARVVWEHGPAVTYENFRRLLDERARRGELVVDDTQLAAEQFIAGIVGHIQLKVAMGVAEPPDAEEIRRRVASAVRTFVARYGALP